MLGEGSTLPRFFPQTSTMKSNRMAFRFCLPQHPHPHPTSISPSLSFLSAPPLSPPPVCFYSCSQSQSTHQSLILLLSKCGSKSGSGAGSHTGLYWLDRCWPYLLSLLKGSTVCWYCPFILLSLLRHSGKKNCHKNIFCKFGVKNNNKKTKEQKN